MSKLTIRLIAAWIVLQSGVTYFQIGDQRVMMGVSVVGLAAAFFAFVDTTSYRAVRKTSKRDRP